jgi:hypothetical protein
MHAITRHREARAMLTDPRFAPSPASYAARPDVPDEYRPYLRTMQEQDGPGHLRLRRAVAPAFTPRRVERYRARIAELVDGLLADIPTDDGALDLLNGLARPLPMAVICAVIGVPAADRPRWHGYGAMVSAGDGKAFAAAIPAIIDDAKAVLAAPEDGLVTDLVRTGALDDTEIVTLIWHLVLAGPGAHPAPRGRARRPPAPPRPARRRAGTAGAAVEELLRWCGPQLLAVPRFPSADVDVGGVPIAAGTPVTVLLGRGQPRPRASSPIPTRSTSAATPKATSPSCTARTSASAPPSPGWRRRSRSPRYWTVAAPAPRRAVRAPDPATWRLTTFTAAASDGESRAPFSETVTRSAIASAARSPTATETREAAAT